jgi:hypothetical protein
MVSIFSSRVIFLRIASASRFSTATRLGCPMSSMQPPPTGAPGGSVDCDCEVGRL